MKNKILLLITAFVISCNTSETDYKVEQTISQLSASLEADKETNFRNIIINRTATMPEDLHYDLLRRLYDKSSLKDQTIEPELIDENNHMGQTVYRLPYFQGTDSLTGITNLNLILYFGPTELFPVDQLSDFETEIEYNKDLRRKILEQRFNVNLE